MTEVALENGQVLCEQRAPIEYAYFPDTAVVSLLSRMANDAVVEVGTIGNEGAVGLSLSLGATARFRKCSYRFPAPAGA